MNINKDSRIVEVFSKEMLKSKVDHKEVKDAHEYIKELASNPNPNNRYEIAQIMSFIINDGLNERVNYIEQIADVKRTALGEKAQFQVEVDGVKAFFQAKSASTERSKVSTNYFGMETEEVSARPIVNFLDLVTGKVNLVDLANKATTQMELAIVKRIQDSVFAAFSSMSTPNYASGAGIAKAAFDPILHSMMRVSGGASIVGDIEALSKFTGIAGYNGVVPDQYVVEQNQNGMIGSYLGGKLVKLNNPFESGSLTDTVLRKDLVYVIPNGPEELRPIKVQFEGGVQTMDAPANINSKAVEFRFDQYVGVKVGAVRKLLGVYEDTSL